MRCPSSDGSCSLALLSYSGIGSCPGRCYHGCGMVRGRNHDKCGECDWWNHKAESLIGGARWSSTARTDEQTSAHSLFDFCLYIYSFSSW